MEATGQPGRESLGEGGGAKGLLGRPGHAQQAQCSRIATLPFFEVGCACEVGFGLKVVLPARNRLIGSVGWFLIATKYTYLQHSKWNQQFYCLCMTKQENGK